jgi:hypothetical protein
MRFPWDIGMTVATRNKQFAERDKRLDKYIVEVGPHKVAEDAKLMLKEGFGSQLTEESLKAIHITYGFRNGYGLSVVWGYFSMNLWEGMVQRFEPAQLPRSKKKRIRKKWLKQYGYLLGMAGIEPERFGHWSEVEEYILALARMHRGGNPAKAVGYEGFDSDDE